MRSGGMSNPAIDKLLDKGEELKLEELLREDEIIQEIQQSRNGDE